MIVPGNINKYAKKDPEKILNDNLIKKYGQRFIDYRKRYEENVNKKSSEIDYLDYPNTVLLELVNRCDLECTMCYQGFRNDANKSVLDESILDKIFIDFKKNKLNSLMFSASEPLLYKKINTVFQRAKDADIMDIFLFSNGTLLNEKNSRMILESSLTRLFISIDAASEETYNKVRIPVSKRLLDQNRLEKLENNIKNFIHLRDNVYKKTLPLVRTSFVALDKNKHEINAFINKWKNIVDSVEIQKKVIPHSAFEEAKMNEIRSEKVIMKDYDCKEPWGQMTIWSDGTVSPCCATFGRNIPIGNVTNQTISELWRSKNMQSIRESFRENTPKSVCKTCINNTVDHISG
tara:strand:- start:10053 stop:11096 length:1044 start_codon:yes stop_codon:yes gene_type:complete